MNQDFKTWVSKIALGTVQFGLDYGISNKTGQIPESEAEAILTSAFDTGIGTLDTAAAYGSSESVIGSILQNNACAFELISKLPTGVAPEHVLDTLHQSLQRLGVAHLQGYLAHKFSDFQNPDLRQVLLEAKQRGLIQAYGVSVYYPDEVKWLLDENVAVDIVQLPFNVFDQRFRDLLFALKERHIEIHARSVFLQGLFFVPVSELSPHFDSVKANVQALQQLGERIPLSALLLNYAVMQSEIDKVVIGITNTKELQANMAAFDYFDPELDVYQALNRFATTDEEILLPFHWR